MAEKETAPVAEQEPKKKKERIYSKKNLMMAGGQLTGSFYLTSCVVPFLTLVVVTYGGLDPVVFGQIQGVNTIIGFILCFVTGILFQKVHLPWGKARSWQYVGCIIGCICTGLAFSLLPLPEGMPKIIFYWIVLIVGQELYGIAASGSYVLFPMMTPNPKDRINASAVMVQVSQLVGILWRSLMVPLIALLGSIAGSVESGYSIYAWIIMALVIGFYFLMAHAGKPYDPSDKMLKAGFKPLGTYEGAEDEKDARLVDMIRAFFTRNPLSFIFSKLFRDMGLFMINATIAYNFTFVYPSAVIMGLYFALNAFAGLIGAIISPEIAKRFNIKVSYIAMEIGMIVFCVLGYFFGVTAVSSLVFLVFVMLCYYGCLGLEKSMFSNAAEYTVMKIDKPVRPFLMTLMTLPGKMSSSLAPSILGFALAFIAFNKDNVTAFAAQGIHTIITLGPAIFVVLSIICILFYNVNKEKLDAMRAKYDAEHNIVANEG